MQAILPRFDVPVKMTQAQVAAMIDTAVSDLRNGTNYRITDSNEFDLKNADTGLFNKIETSGADGAQTIDIANGAA